MLKVLGYSQSMPSEIEVSEYVPFRYRLLTARTSAPLYWRTGDYSNTLIEVALVGRNASSKLPNGLLQGLTIVSLSKSSVTLKTFDKGKEVEEMMDVLPICDISDWPQNRFKDEHQPFHVALQDTRFTITFSNNRKIRTICHVDTTQFGIDVEKNLAFLSFDLTKSSDLNILSSYLA